MANQIYLLRHGETSWSLTGQHTSRTDLPLTQRGEHQALRLRERLQGVSFAQVLTSPLQRARRTCELAGLGAAARTEPDLQEWNYGAYEGRTSAHIRAERPGWNIFFEGCPEGELPGQIAQRADRLLGKLRRLDGITALFSHGHFLRALAVRWIRKPVEEARHFALDTGALSLLGLDPADPEIPTICRWNIDPTETSALAALPDTKKG